MTDRYPPSTAHEELSGDEDALDFADQDECPECDGTGADPDGPGYCPECGGNPPRSR